MRVLILLICSLLLKSVKGQATIDNIVSKATCACIDNFLNPETDTTSFYKCFIANIGKDTELIKRESVKIYGDSTNKSFHKLASDVFDRNSETLIFSCDAFFKLIDSTRYSQISGLNKGDLSSTLESLNKIGIEKQDIAFHIKRGMTNFGLQDYDNAIADFDFALSINSNMNEIIFFKAWALENQKKYDEAIKLYTNLASETKNHEYRIFAAVAKRKKNSL